MNRRGFVHALVHVDCDGDKDYKSRLSYGERNVISLLLFLLKVREQDELVIIDDPVSSYDEFRRIMVYRMIFELNLSSTVLVLSHDHVFAKYALFFQEKASRKVKQNASLSLFEKACAEKTGCIVHLENADGVLDVCDLKPQDYGVLQSHILRRLSEPNLTVRQKVINLRMYLETVEHSDGAAHVAYGYMSALLHYREGDDITSKIGKCLASCGYREIDILEWLAENTKVSFPEVGAIDPGSLLDDAALCPFERLIALRESVDDGAVKAELNDMVHLNAALVYCLDPCKYAPCSNKARRLLAMCDEA